MLINKTYKRQRVTVQQMLVQRIQELTNIEDYFVIHRALSAVNPVVTFSYETIGVCYIKDIEELTNVIFNLKEK